MYTSSLIVLNDMKQRIFKSLVDKKIHFVDINLVLSALICRTCFYFTIFYYQQLCKFNVIYNNKLVNYFFKYY